MTDVMREQFQRMGARVKVATSDRVRAIEVDVQHDRLGEFSSSVTPLPFR